jgi:NAD(P)-dependent dehydrogenase (short-subunit alcohol dehydrogenase family)
MSASELFDLSGKVALVTGGNSGLGFGFATGLAKCGADLVIWGRREGQNQEAAEALLAHGGKVMTQQVDVSSEDEVVTAMRLAIESVGRLDCVVSNAGFATQQPFDEMTTETYSNLLATNQHGGFFTLREAVRHMKQRAIEGDPGGSIIVCGSLSISRGVPGLAHYGAAKGALASITQSIAVEYGRYGIRANVVAPGSIYTGMMGGAPEEMIPLTAALQERNPIPRWGYPEDVEGIAAYLASDAARYHTGDVIIIDGGASALIV